MNFIGNDIVDLKLPEAVGKSKDLRFINKVLNTHEQHAVYYSDFPDAMLWALWAAKESAYKAVSKSDPAVGSAPGHYPVQLDSITTSHDAFGVVVTPKGPVMVKIEFGAEYVHCLGLFGPKDILPSIVYDAGPICKRDINGKSISEIESAAVRYLAIKGIASYLKMAEKDISIFRHKKNNKRMPPAVSAKGYSKPMDISLSHDGRFAAYAFLTT